MGNLLRFCFLFLFFFTVFALAEENPWNKPIANRNPHSVMVGMGILGAQFITLPLMEQWMCGGGKMSFVNPLEHIGEPEPYLEDKVWHFIGAHTTTAFHYKILHTYFGMNDPIIPASLVSLAFWTGMECFDVGLGTKFSIQDEIANVLGIGFGMLKHTYPSLPIQVRVGVKEWYGLMQNIYESFEANTTDNLYRNYYALMKTEVIYTFNNCWYAGLAISVEPGVQKKDMFGATVGFDILSYVSRKFGEEMQPTFEILQQRCALSITATYWQHP
jgi:hypothetical protein